LHAVSQHTESAQWPVAHSASSVHFPPGLIAHVPSWPAAAQVPSGHADAAQQTASTHVSPFVQPLVVVHALPRPSSGVHTDDLQ
jgi:hypothetical protein